MQALNERALPWPVSDGGIGVKPFVKWIGGKRQLLPHLLPLFEGTDPSATYHEPFVGGGAVFFALRTRGQAAKSRLSDVNRELINGYTAIRDHLEDVIACLKRHEKLNAEEYFYKIRAQKPRELPEIAARLVYLNKTCFNGLYRVNNSGGFNAPWGKYDNPTICDESNLRAVSATLANAILDVAPFPSVLDATRPADVVYFDPPYVPMTAASFTEYIAGGFGGRDHEVLASTFRELDKKNVRVILSNSDTKEVRKLYAGFRIDQVFARRNVNTRGDRRGPVAEVIVRNF